MADFLNPAPYLEDLAEVFRGGASDPAGITFDPELCRAFVEGLGDVAGKVDALAAYVAAAGLVERIQFAADRPRTPVERRNLARLSAPLDPAGRVMSFPTAPVRRVAVSEGGSAA